MLQRLFPPVLGLLVLAGQAVAEPLELQISRAECLELLRHTARGDVAYQPGVDVRGQPVVPADLDDRPPLRLPESYRIQIEVDTAERFGLPSRSERFDADIAVGEVEITLDGRAYFNGQPLQSDEAFELSQRCQERLKTAE